MKIAVFSYFFPSTGRVYISSLCDMLTQLGHEVYIFNFFIDDPDCFDQESLNKSMNTHNTISTFFLIYRVAAKIKNFLYKYFPFMRVLLKEFGHKYKLNKDFRTIRRELKVNHTFDCSIGIEKGGIICAHQLFKLYGIPFYYLSLELYGDNHPTVQQPSMFKTMRVMEIAAHKKAAGTIIADEERKDFLYKIGDIDTAKPAFFLPISFDESTITYDLSFFKNNGFNKKIILNFGYNRMPDDFFISLIKKMPSDFIFFMHHRSTEYHEEIAHQYSLENVHFSNNILDEKGIMNMIADSFIGVCWYQDETANDRLTAFSSEKTARYLATGKPIIANANTNFSRLFASVKCGIAVNSPEEFIEALQVITLNYQEFSQQARKTFDLFYKLTNYQQSLNTFLQSNLQVISE